jgi:beta-glucosidase
MLPLFEHQSNQHRHYPNADRTPEQRDDVDPDVGAARTGEGTTTPAAGPNERRAELVDPGAAFQRLSIKTDDSNTPEPGDQPIRETDPVTSEPSATSNPTADRARTIVADMTTDEKLWCLDGDAPFWIGLTYLSEQGYHKSPFRAARVDRLGLPGFAFSDGPRGVVVDHATCFPVSMARGATWDVDLEERIGEAIGVELRAVGADLYGGVCVNLLRHPAWGRAQETYGEDPYHVGEMGAALTRGVQRHAMACVKHFACNSMENARFTVDITIDETALHEVYLPHFRRIVEEGVAAVMSAYNSVNNEWCGQSEALLTGVLRDEWGFDGFVISDWIFGLRDAGRSLRAGLDVEMPYRMVRAERLEPALRQGEVNWLQVDRAVERVVATRLRFDEILRTPAPDRSVLASPTHRALAREAAAKAVVMLRNEPVDGTPVLPLTVDSGSSVALLGRLAVAVNLGDGGSSDVWAPEVVTVADGLRAARPGVDLRIDEGADPDAAAAVAASTGCAVVVVGYTRDDEGEFVGEVASDALKDLFPGKDDPGLVERFTAEIATERTIQPPVHVAPPGGGVGFAMGGDRRSLHLHDDDIALIRAVSAANRLTVVAIVAGSAVVISEWDRGVPAVVQSWYSGMEGGHGLADVLLGRVDAAGRLPFSVPVREADLPAFVSDSTAFTYDSWHGYWHLDRHGTVPAYPFGFGLSYTSFDLERAEIELAPTGTWVRVEASVRNTGLRAGSDVVQIYARRVGSDRPERLIGFRRIDIGPGDCVAVELDLPLKTLAERDTERHAMVVRPGAYRIRVARHSSDPGIAAEITLG